MLIIIKNHTFQYDVENIAEIFFPYEKIKMLTPEELKNADEAVKNDPVRVLTEKNGAKLFVEAFVWDEHLALETGVSEGSDGKNEMAVLMYRVLSKILGIEYPWGILYGVRPARFMHSLTDKFSADEARNIFKNQYLVTDEKINLTQSVMERENRTIALSKDNSFSLYVSIPFCPTRCSYCSFVSHSIENTHKLIEPYVKLLGDELIATANYAKNLALRLESVYFGGGTPTILTPRQLEFLFKTIAENFDLTTNREYTVEAGRPDTITPEKLETLRSFGVDRISINPQTFNDDVRAHIGRRHTTEETLKAYDMAKTAGFENINMDFIAGLPTETVESFCDSINRATELEVPSITVHTLSLKSGAYMATRENAFDFTDARLAKSMVEYSQKALSNSGYVPYYMYRQGKCLGNLENVGWCKNDTDCLYNIFMMDETHTVLAVGAGAVTKLKNPKTGKISRIYNYKYPYEYIDHFGEILRRKEAFVPFYAEI